MEAGFDTAMNSPIFTNLQSKICFFVHKVSHMHRILRELCMPFYLVVMVIELVLTAIGMYTNSKNNQFLTLVDYLSEK